MKEHPARAKLRMEGGFSEPVEIDALSRAIEKANATHYSDARPTPDTREVVITTKADIKNSKHRASPETMKRFDDKLKDGE